MSAHTSWMLGLILLSILSQPSLARLHEPDQVWNLRFEPPYSDETLRIQLKVNEWWTAFDDTAVITKGTQVPIETDSCANDASKCRVWTAPGDVAIKVGPPPRGTHHVVLYLIDTGDTVNVYSSPYETQTNGCSQASNSLCCNGLEYNLKRDVTPHKVYQMWSDRPNSTHPWDGKVRQNYRSMKLSGTITSGSLTTTATWDNIFFNKQAAIDGQTLLQATTDFVQDSGATLLDPIAKLVDSHLLLLPTTDKYAAGFVVPKTAYPATAKAIDYSSWSACRSSQCGKPLGSCNPTNQPPTPFSEHLSTTSGDVVAALFNALGRPMQRSCKSDGLVQNEPFLNNELKLDATHLAQYISCDYIGTTLYPTFLVSRSAVEVGNIQPPSPTPTPATPFPSSPVPSTEDTPPAVITGVPPTASIIKPEGPVIVFTATLPGFTPASFETNGKLSYIRFIQKTAIGASKPPQVVLLEVASVASRRLRSNRRLQQDAITVDTSVQFYSPDDSVTAQGLLTSLQEDPRKVLTSSQFAGVSVAEATELNCVVPCGDHGSPVPWVNDSGSIGCKCECDAGWSTAPNQSFDNFKPCSVKDTGSLPPNGSPSTNGTTVPVPPPPAPMVFKEDDGGLNAGKWIGIVVAIIILAVAAFLVWKFWAKIVPCFAGCWAVCTKRSKTVPTDEQNAGAGNKANTAASKANVEKESVKVEHKKKGLAVKKTAKTDKKAKLKKPKQEPGYAQA